MTDTTAVQRLGIVLNWVGIAGACISMLGVAAIAVSYATNGITNPADANTFAIMCAFLAGLSYAIGRALRYVLAGF